MVSGWENGNRDCQAEVNRIIKRRGNGRMTTKILAQAMSFIDDGYSTLLGFADDPSTPVHYVMLNMKNQPDGKDSNLGQGGIHLDAGKLHVHGYDLVQDIRETEAGVVVSLVADVAQKARISQDIEIELKIKTLNGVSVGEAVQGFKDRLSSWKA